MSDPVLLMQLERACPVGWTIKTERPGLLVFRTAQLPTPQGLSVEVEYANHTAEARVRLDPFCESPVQGRLQSVSDVSAERCRTAASASGWETRITALFRPASDTWVRVTASDPDGLKVDGAPAAALDCVAAIGACLALALLPAGWEGTAEEAIDLSAEGLPEGAATRVTVNRFERDPRNREAALKIHGHRCLACDVDFGERYGFAWSGFIHVHHVVPVSQLGLGYVINPAVDLVPLCPNCHAAVHRKNPPYTVAELRNALSGWDSPNPPS